MRRHLNPALLLFVGALAIRLLFLLDSADNPTFDSPIITAQAYDLHARDWVRSAELSPDAFWIPAFYHFFLSAVYFAFNYSSIAAKILQALLGATTCVLIYRIGLRLFGAKEGILAGAILACFGPHIFYTGELLPAVWSVSWMALLLLSLSRMSRAPSRAHAFLLGMTGSLATLANPAFFAAWLAPSVYLLWRQRMEGGRRLVRRAMVVSVGFVILAFPVAMLNVQSTGRASFMPNEEPVRLYLANNPDSGRTAVVRPGPEYRAILAEDTSAGMQSATQQAAYFRSKVFTYALTNTGSFLKGIGTRAVETFSAREVPGSVDMYLFREWSGLLSMSVWKGRLFGFPSGLLIPAGLAGLVLLRRRLPLYLYLVMAFFCLYLAIYGTSSELRLPLMAPLAVTAGASIIAVVQAVRSKRYSVVLQFSALLTAFLLLGMMGPFAGEHLELDAELYRALAQNESRAQRDDQAAEYYRRALERNPADVTALNGLGSLMLEGGRAEEAERIFRRVTAIAPTYALACFNLATIAHADERTEEAKLLYARGLSLEPMNPLAHNEVGLILLRENRIDEALQHLRLATELAPGMASFAVDAARALILNGQYQDALALLRNALSLSPASAEIHQYLGVCLQNMNEPAQATGHLIRALQLDERLPLAHRLLGEIRESEGDHAAAEDDFLRAGELDPTLTVENRPETPDESPRE